MNVSMRKTGYLGCAIGCTLAYLGCPAQLSAQCEVQKLTPSDAASNDQFGNSVSVSGDVAVVGARGVDCAAGFDCGAVYVYRSNSAGWVREQKLTAGDIEQGAFFGTSASVSGNVLLVGADSRDCNAGIDCGAAYVFRYNGSTWVREQKLRAFVQAAGNLFGSSVAVSGDVAVMGAPGEDCAAGTDCGAAYVYRFNGSWWEQEQKLASLEPMRNDLFGGSVAVNGDVAVVGAPLHSCAAGYACGAAYVYRFNGSTWVVEQKLTASDSKPGGRFGVSVFVAGNIAIAGADHADCARYPRCGAAYVYRFDGSAWIEEQKLTASDGGPEERFGYSVSASGDAALVGAPTDYYSGAAYVFRLTSAGWVEEKKLKVFPGDSSDQLGTSVSVDGNLGVVGAVYGDSSCYDCGAAYIFALGPDCNENGEADFCDIRDSRSRDADGDGVPDECEVITAALDIKPGACPNPFNPKSQGVLPVAVVGSPTFDVTQIDTDSLTLKRADGVGGSVRPLAGPPGPGIRYADVATPFSGIECGCNDLRADGLEDLTLKFSTPDLAQALQLSSFAAGASVELTLGGTLRDGTPFRASDCIIVTGAAVSHLSVEVADERLAIPDATSRHSHAETVLIPVGRTDPKD